MELEDYIKDVGNNLDFNDLSFCDIGNGLLLTNKEIRVLKDYDISYANCKNLKEIIRLVEERLDEFDDSEDLEDISLSLSERDYYINTNK